MNSGIPFIKIADPVEVTINLKGRRVSGPPPIFLNGRVKSGQRWSGQNRPTDVARDSRCFTLSFAY